MQELSLEDGSPKSILVAIGKFSVPEERSTGAEDRPSPRQFVYKLRLPFVIDSVLSGNGRYHILCILPDV